MKASATIYIMADGSVNPPTAPIQRDGYIYAFSSNINEPIVVQRDSIVIDGLGFTLQGTGAYDTIGILLSRRSNITIKNVKIKAFWYVIYLYRSSNNSISGNNITANSYCGIRLWESSNNNSIFGNNITDSGEGIVLFLYSNNNSIFANNIVNNENGIMLYESSDNSIYHNNFINNTGQVFTELSVNVWDDGVEGNYWSDYDGVDANADGIGETPYVVDENNQDRYPLMEIIPEFPSVLILPLFMMATLLAVIAYRRKLAHEFSTSKLRCMHAEMKDHTR